MKQGQTLQDLAKELRRQREAQRDFQLPAKLLTLKPDRSVEFGLTNEARGAWTENFQTSGLFIDQLATGWAGIPKKYVDKMTAEAPELLATNVNHWLEDDDRPRLVRTMDGTARAFLSNRYRTIDNVGVVEAVLPTFIQHDVAMASCEVTEQHLWLKGVNHKRNFEVRKGDVVQVGISISNSEVGLGAVKVDPLIYRLVCLNGAILPDSGIRKFHIGRRLDDLNEAVEVFQNDTRVADDKAFFLKLRDVVVAAF
ncbi:MAG TPA: DUF932 domain-containing protein, partial [Chloroflexota bacterium]|nr:DUF932 domain-containing protein [Chloroflexota bacterium]